jgi:signal transduction histidine kinase
LNFLTAQNLPDSLDLILHNTQADTSRLNLLLSYAEEFRRSDTTLTFKYAEQAEELSIKLNDSFALAEAWYHKGIAYKHKAKYTKSLDYLDKTLRLRKKYAEITDDPDTINIYAATFRNIGNVYFYLGLYQEATKYILEGVQLFEKTDNYRQIYISSITLASIYNAQKEFDEALRIFNDVLNESIEEGDSAHICMVYLNIGAVYGNMEQYDKAQEYFEESLKIAQKINDISIIGTTYSNMGLIHKNKKDFTKAVEYYFKGLEYRKLLNNPFKISGSYSNIGYSYYEMGQYNKALKYLKQSYQIAQNTKSLTLKKQVLEPLHLVYYKLGDYKRAYQYQSEYKIISDSLLNESNTEEITKLKMQFDFNKQLAEQELEKQKLEAINNAEIMHQKDLRNIFLAAFIVMSLFVVFLIRSFFIKRNRNRLLAKQKIEIQEKNEELIVQKNEIEEHKNEIKHQKELLEKRNQDLNRHRNELEKRIHERTIDFMVAKEKAEEADRLKTAFIANMSHEVKTPMNAIVGFSDIILNRNSKGKNLNRLLENIIISTRDLQNLLNNIIDVAKIEAGQINLLNEEICMSELFIDIVNEMKQKCVKSKDIKFTLKNDITINVYSDKLRLKQVIGNILENSVKYTEKGTIEAGFYKENKSVIVYVKDTGVGMSEDNIKVVFKRFSKIEDQKEKLYRGAGLGLFIAKNLIELMGGKIWIESQLNAGTKVLFSIPKK